jgi:hypothetical protein
VLETYHYQRVVTPDLSPCFRGSLFPERTLFDEQGNKTDVPDKERQIEAFQLLFMLLPPANRSLLKLLLDLLYHTARNQHANKMSAINLATMFAPHIIWPKNVGRLRVLWSRYVCSLKIWLTVMGCLKGDAVYYVGDRLLKSIRQCRYRAAPFHCFFISLHVAPPF